MSRMTNWYEAEALIRDRQAEVTRWVVERRQAKLAVPRLRLNLGRWLATAGVAFLKLQGER